MGTGRGDGAPPHRTRGEALLTALGGTGRGFSPPSFRHRPSAPRPSHGKQSAASDSGAQHGRTRPPGSRCLRSRRSVARGLGVVANVMDEVAGRPRSAPFAEPSGARGQRSERRHASRQPRARHRRAAPTPTLDDLLPPPPLTSALLPRLHTPAAQSVTRRRRLPARRDSRSRDGRRCSLRVAPRSPLRKDALQDFDVLRRKVVHLRS